MKTAKTNTEGGQMYHYRTVPAWSRWERVIYYFLCLIGLAVIGGFAYWWFAPSHIPHNFTGVAHAGDIVLFALLSYVVWYQIVVELFTWYTGLHMRHPVPTEPEEGLRVAIATAFVPKVEPYDVLEKALKAMQAVTYPHDTWVLDEGDDEEVKALCAKYGAHHFSRFGIEKYNQPSGHFKAKTKAGNYNAWWDAHGYAYEIVAQHDVDFSPEPNWLDRTLGYFKDPEVAFVGTPQIYGNINESWIARAAAEQAYGFYGPVQKGLFGQNMQLFIGANHVIRTAAHDSIEGYSGHIVEDHLTGMRLYAKRWKSVFVPEILLVGEGPATWGAYFSQQMRWAYGLIDILFRYTPRLTFKMRPRHSINYILLQQYYFFGVVQFLGLILIGSYFIFGWEITRLDLTTLLIFYPAFLIMQIIVGLWLQRAYIDYKVESGYHLYGKFLNIVVWPIYFLALASAFVGRKISYQVTPKGTAQQDTAESLSLFVTQIMAGVLASSVVLIGFLTDRINPYMALWCLLTAGIMFGAIALVSWNKIWQRHMFERSQGLLAVNQLLVTSLLLALFGLNGWVFYQTFDTTGNDRPFIAENPSPSIENQLALAERDEVTYPTEIIHEVQPNESLREIADTYYGDESAWKRIPHDDNPDLLLVGEELIIPLP